MFWSVCGSAAPALDFYVCIPLKGPVIAAMGWVWVGNLDGVVDCSCISGMSLVKSSAA